MKEIFAAFSLFVAMTGSAIQDGEGRDNCD
jgi:hypothetical protein